MFSNEKDLAMLNILRTSGLVFCNFVIYQQTVSLNEIVVFASARVAPVSWEFFHLLTCRVLVLIWNEKFFQAHLIFQKGKERQKLNIDTI